MNEETSILQEAAQAQQAVRRLLLQPGMTAVILIVQFVARMYHAHKLKKTDWKNFDKFMKFCDYHVEVANLPLSDQDLAQAREIVLQQTENKELSMEDVEAKAKEIAKARIKTQMDAAGIHYCMMDNDFNADHIKIYYHTADKSLMQDFISDYIKSHLLGGEMDKEELNRMMGQKTSIISVPDALEEKICAAMTAAAVSYAKIKDLDLADGKKQMYIPQHQLQTVSQLYSEIRQGLLAEGMEDPGPLEEMTQEQLNTTAICKDDQDFVERCDKEHRMISLSYVDDSSVTYCDVIERYEPLGSSRSIDFLQSAQYEQISIDKETLVDGMASFVYGDENIFACRLPGTYGDTTQFLLLDKDQVFFDSAAAKPRYIAFVDKTAPPKVVDRHGKAVEKFEKGMDLIDHVFDRHKLPLHAAPSVPAPKMRV